MKDLYQQALRYLREMWQRRWAGLAVAWIVAVLGVAVVYRIPERYEASARLYVDTETLLKPLLMGLAIQPNVDQQVALISRTLISRPNVEKLVRMADLDLRATSPAERDELIDSVMRTIRLSGSNSMNLYVLSYRDPNPEQARRVVQSLLTIFVESSLGDKRQDSRAAVRFLDEQIKRYEEHLRAAEGRLKEFRLRYIGTGAREGGDFFSRLATIQGQIDGAQMELRAAEQARDAYKRELAGERPTFLPEGPDPRMLEATPEIDARLAGLRKELDELLRRFTDKHPDVTATRRLIEQLEEQKRAEIEARRKGDGARIAPSSTDRNPVFQQLRISLAESEAQVAGARAKVAGYEAQYRQLRTQAQLVPQVEAEFAQLNRDYDVQKRTYESLLARRESAGIGIEVQDSGGAQFRIIDPPRVLPHPVAPNRIALLGIAFAAALAAGLLAALVVSQVKPTFNDARTLRDVTRRPVVGTVSLLSNDAQRRSRRRGAVLFAGGLGGLIATIVAVFAFALMVGRVA